MIILDSEIPRPSDKTKETDQPTLKTPSQKATQLEHRGKVPPDIQRIYALERHFYW